MAPTIERLTAAAAEEEQRRFAAGLLARGLGPGDRIGVEVPTSAAALCLNLGALRRGIVPVPLNPGLLPAERNRLLVDAEVALVVDEPMLVGLQASDQQADLAPVPLARPMHYTSGTTGEPKGVWSGVLPESAAQALVDEERELWGFESADTHLVASHLHHSAPLRFAAGTLLAGGAVVVTGGFDARRVAQAIAEHRPTSTFMAPAHVQRLLTDLGAPPPLDSFRLLAHAGAPCPEPLKLRLLEATRPGAAWEFYGATECQFTACGPDEWRARPGTVGRARPGRALRTDDDGLIWCRVPDHGRFVYWQAPDKTAAAWDGDWFTAGDLGRLDDDGYLFLDGRRDDLVISGGVNVYPAEVERALATAPGVVEVAVFGIDDERWGQRVCAAVVGSASPEGVMAHARARLAAYKCPKAVYVVEAIPTTGTGKVRRSTLAADLGLI